MGLEHLMGAEVQKTLESSEGRWETAESERPGERELPHVAELEEPSGESWETAESERPGERELPHVAELEEPSGESWETAESERPGERELPHVAELEEPSGESWEMPESERPGGHELPHVAELEEPSEERWEPGDGGEPGNLGDAAEKQDAEDGYYSTYEERLRQTPAEDGERGEWSGERGESEFTPNDENIKDILARYGKESISYENGIPDFSEVSEATVEIDNMTEDRAENFRQCDEKCAQKWNEEGRDGRTDWTARDVKEWRQENGYTWHERNDMKTCDLVPTEVNAYFGHLGGVAECRKRDAGNGGNEFDE